MRGMDDLVQAGGCNRKWASFQRVTVFCVCGKETGFWKTRTSAFKSLGCSQISVTTLWFLSVVLSSLHRMAKLGKDILDLWEASSGVDRPPNASLLIISDACYSGEWVLWAGIREDAMEQICLESIQLLHSLMLVPFAARAAVNAVSLQVFPEHDVFTKSSQESRDMARKHGAFTRRH